MTDQRQIHKFLLLHAWLRAWMSSDIIAIGLRMRLKWNRPVGAGLSVVRTSPAASFWLRFIASGTYIQARR